MTSILQAARSGDRRMLLEALRDHIASMLDDGVPAREEASLTKRLVEVVEMLDALPDAEANEVDAMAALVAEYDEYDDDDYEDG